MTHRFFSQPSTLRRLCAGPWGDHVESFATLLAERGYARTTGARKIRDVADLNRWLARRHLRPPDLDEREVARFLRRQRRRGRLRCGTPGTLREFLAYLRERGVVRPVPARTDGTDDPIEDVLSCFSRYLAHQRGLSAAIVNRSVRLVRPFLLHCCEAGCLSAAQVEPAEISRFILRHARALSPARAKLLVGALRSFFRFLLVRGETTRNLADCVPSVADWRLSELPKSLPRDSVQRLLSSCDRTTAVGIRNYAILLLLARLGLRAGEVVAMTLDDVDWERGELTVRGKGRWHVLPLPQDVGEALACYLRDARPRCTTRRLFVRARAPHQGFTSSVAICYIVGSAIKKAGVSSFRSGAHVLRHSLAQQMLDAGASLAEIGDILGHRAQSSTEVYTKVDLKSLRELVQVWPGGDA